MSKFRNDVGRQLAPEAGTARAAGGAGRLLRVGTAVLAATLVAAASARAGTPPTFFLGSDISADAGAGRDVALADLDGDGDLDVVVANEGAAVRVYINRAAGGFTGADLSSDVRDTVALALGDVDGDGDIDVVAGNHGQVNRLYRNDGSGGFTGSDITSDAGATTSVALGDMNGDGRPDLVVGNDGQPNRLYLNDGNGDPFDTATGTDITADADPTAAVAVGDVNGDGRLDVVAGNGGGVNRLYLNDGDGDPFDAATGSDITSDEGWTTAVALGDVNGDGRLDVVAGNGDGKNRLYLNDGDGDPFDTAAGTNVSADEHSTRAVLLVDMDRDGDLDAVAGNYGEANRLYLNDGDGDPFDTATGSDVTADAHWTTALAAGDIRGDGQTDLVAANDLQADRLYLNLGARGPGDLNADGTVDELDLALAADHFGLTAGNAGWDARADANGDRVVNVDDLTVVTAHYGNNYL